MKKKIVSLLLLFVLLCTVSMPVSAKTHSTDKDWRVSFTTNKKMESNFKTKDMDELIYGLQPGDDANISLKLRNENATTTDWYMTNEVLNSLEDRSLTASGGAYTYRLVYTNANGVERVLFDSDTVGGDTVGAAGEGLNEATDALKDYFYLDTLTNGQSGTIDLTVALEGETQGNDYQDTLADLQMNFAVELNETGIRPVFPEEIEANPQLTPTPTDITPSSTVSTTSSRTSSRTRTPLVRTGDEYDIVPYLIVALVTGVLLLIFAIYSMRQHNKRKRRGL